MRHFDIFYLARLPVDYWIIERLLQRFSVLVVDRVDCAHPQALVMPGAFYSADETPAASAALREEFGSFLQADYVPTMRVHHSSATMQNNDALLIDRHGRSVGIGAESLHRWLPKLMSPNTFEAWRTAARQRLTSFGAAWGDTQPSKVINRLRGVEVATPGQAIAKVGILRDHTGMQPLQRITIELDDPVQWSKMAVWVGAETTEAVWIAGDDRKALLFGEEKILREVGLSGSLAADSAEPDDSPQIDTDVVGWARWFKQRVLRLHAPKSLTEACQTWYDAAAVGRYVRRKLGDDVAGLSA